MIWFQNATLEQINAMCPNTLMERLEIKYTDIGPEHLTATMPVGPATHQPMGLLHGGASVALAESVGSMASALIVDLSKFAVVGSDISAKHIRGKKSGTVTALAKPIHIGRKTHVWNIDIVDEEGKLISACRFTNMIIEINAKS